MSVNFMDLCRLCLVKEKVSIPIFEGEGDARQIFVKIAACLPVKVERNDKLPKKICDNCLYKVENVYQFWNTTANSEKQLLQWLGEATKHEATPSASTVLETEELMMKVEAEPEQVSKDVSKEKYPLTKRSEEEESVSEDEEEGGSVSEDSMTDGGDTHEGPNKEEVDSDEDAYGELEPTTFVNVSMACEDQAGPSGVQQPTEDSSQANKLDILSVGQSQAQPSSGSAATTAPSGYSSGRNSKVHGQWMSKKRKSSNPRKRDVRASSEKSDRVVLKKPYKRRSEPASADKGTSTIDNAGPEETDATEVKVKREEEERNDTRETALYSARPKQWYTRIEGAERSYKCNRCERAYKYMCNLRSHQRVHEGEEKYVCEVCGHRTHWKDSLKIHMKTHEDDRPFKCEVCQKTFKYSSNFHSHQKVHAETKSYKCDTCDYETCWKDCFKIHMQRHTLDLPFNCDQCGQRFPTRSYLNTHMKKHTGVHKCDVCGKVYSTKASLTEHRNSRHDAKKPHACQHCDKSFPYKSSLRMHARMHAGKREKSSAFLCDLCGRALSSNESLRLHKLTHSGEKSLVCSACGRAFANRIILKAHVRTHTGEKPHACDTCSKRFSARSSLIVHRRYHTGERPYVCHICALSFVSKTHLVRHQKSQHGG